MEIDASTAAHIQQISQEREKWSAQEEKFLKDIFELRNELRRGIVLNVRLQHALGSYLHGLMIRLQQNFEVWFWQKFSDKQLSKA